MGETPPSSPGGGPGGPAPPSAEARSGPAGPDELPADVNLRVPEEDSLFPTTHRKFGTFGGVFTPTLLTILGVIMYLREGWVIGNAGILGGALIIGVAYLITATTALSMSSITTNIRIGAGGAYAIISQSLGLEIGGALGIPRYLSQALAVTMYLFGFREGWLWVFPEHPAILVDFAGFLVLFGIAYKSAGFAIRVQYLIMVVIAASLISIAIAAARGSMQYPLDNVGLWGSFRGAPESGFQGIGFWGVFAVFFPAATGIMAGANMSGDLKDPRRSIPVGTLAAVGVSLVIYLLLAYWLARSATPDELVSNYTIMIDKAFWGPAVLAGLLGATFSSALGSILGAARILQAMGEHGVLPGGKWLGARTAIGEPRNAMLVTGGILMLTILMRDLNAVAPFVTMFFLLTYAMLNGVLLIEQSLGLVSFRPRLRVPRIVPLVGLLGSLLAMFIIHPTFSWMSIAILLGFYWLLLRRRIDAPFTDVRSGLFVAMAEWAAKKVAELPSRQERAWKPNLIVPVEDARELRGAFDLIENLTAPNGSVKIVGLLPAGADPDVLSLRLQSLGQAFHERGVFATSTVIKAGGFSDGLIAGMQALRGAFFKPNIVFVRLPSSPDREDAVRAILAEAEEEGIGAVVFAPHPVVGLARRQAINVWIRDRSPDWRISWDVGNLDLSLLTALKLRDNWNAELRLLMAVERRADEGNARGFLEDLVGLARLHGTAVEARAASFGSFVVEAPTADVSIFGLGPQPDFGTMRRLVEDTRSTCLFVRDSGQESALA